MAGSLLFKCSSEVKGVDFGKQVVQHSYHVHRLPLVDFWKTIFKTEGEKVAELRAITYVPTTNAERFQDFWHHFTLGIGTGHAKVIVFLFESDDMKQEMLRKWPVKVSLGSVKRSLLEPNSHCEMAREKISKGKLTVYVYVVKLKASDKVRRLTKSFEKLQAEIIVQRDVNTESNVRAILGKLGKLLPAVLPAAVTVAAAVAGAQVT